VAKKTNIDWYCERLTILSQEFGAEWLARSVEDVAAGQACPHPIPALWARAKELLCAARGTGKLGLTEELVALFDLATDLETARSLPGYSSAITPEKLKSLQFEDDCYPVHVAAIAVRSGHAVEFVPTSTVAGERTADLFMRADRDEFYVECKKKASYVESAEGISAWGNLQERLLSLRGLIDCDYEVIFAP
jgi:hypothetical protein